MARTYTAGIVTAYGAAKEAGYTGTYEEFCEQQAGFAENAAQVAEDRAAVETIKNTFETVTVPAAVQTVQTEGATQAAAVTAKGTEQVGVVNAAGDAQTGRVQMAGAEEVQDIETAGTTQVGAVNTAGATQVNAVNAAGTTQTGNVNDAGATQIAAIEAKGEETRDSIPEDYTTLSNDVSDLKSSISDIGEIVGIRNVNFTEIDGSFITANGGISDSSTFSRSAPVPVSEGDVVKFNARGYNTNVAMISLVNEDGTNIRPQAISVDSTVRLYTFTVSVDGYIAVSYNKNYEHTLTIENDRIGVLEDAVETIMSTEEITPSDLRNGYIHKDGRFMSASSFRCTYPIRLENETITFIARGYSNIVSLLCLCDENGENRINLVNSTEENLQQTITYTSNGVTYVIISSSLTIPIKYQSVKLKQPVDDPYISLSMFEKFGVIGDSYASGALFFNGQEKDDYAHSWGQIMARRLGTTCTNYSRGGLTTRSWLTDSKGLSLLLNSDAEDIYYLALGINDYYSLGSSYLGSIEDITSHSSYTDYADSFYGNYGRIIEQIKAHAPNAKIVMFTMSLYSATSAKEAFNNAIKEIANHYGLPYINQDDDLFFTSVFFNSTKVEGHPIAITYSGMACAFERLLCDCIKNNVAYFENTFWYA